ncbi:MAG: EamA family transporter [Anaerolineaceae bacterium]|nr:EamA family transporter [Anaerolineaceae bacterium]
MTRAAALQVLLAAALWGTTGTAMTLAPAAADAAGIGAMRLLLGGLALALLAWRSGDLQRARPLPPRALAGAGIMIAAYQLCFFNGISRNGVALGTMVAIGSAPVLAGILEWGIDGRTPGGRWLAATTLALFGCALLLLPGEGMPAMLEPVGLFLSLGAGLSYAGYALTGKRLLSRMSPNAVMALIFLPGALFLLPLLAVRDLKWVLQPGGFLVILHLGLITTALAYLLFARGLQHLAPSVAVTLSLAEPLVAAALGILLLEERPGSRGLLGMIALAAALLWLSVPGTGGRTGENGRDKG